MAISYIGGNANTFVVATSQTIVIPSSAAVGDLLTLWVMCRSALTIPTGWRIIDTKTTPLRSTHTLYLLSKICEAGDIGANLTVTQAVSNRMSAHVQIFRGSAFRMLAVKSIYTDSKSTNTIGIPVLSTRESGDLIVAGATADLQQGNNLTPPSGYTQTTNNGVADNRMCAAYLLPTHPYTTSGVFTFDFSAQAVGIVTIAALISEEAFTPSAYSSEVTVPSGKVGSDLTNFPLLIDLSSMGDGFWSKVRFDGGDLLAYDASDNPLPLDLIYIDPSTKTGLLVVKVPTLAAASDTVIRLDGDGVSDRPASNSTYGRNAVWSDYVTSFWAQGGYFNRVNDVLPTNLGIIICGTGDWLSILSDGNLYWSYATAPANTVFTLGSTSSITATGTHRTIISYNGSSSRVTHNYHDTGQLSVWDSNNTWLYNSTILINTIYQGNVRYNYPTKRDVSVNGVVNATDNTITQTPTGTSFTINIGSATTSGTERMRGSIQYAYLRLDLVSDDWMAAEYNNKNDATFYTVAEAAADVTIDQIFDYAVDIGQDLILDYALSVISQEFVLDYSIQVERSIIFDYSIPVGVDLILDYLLEGTINSGIIFDYSIDLETNLIINYATLGKITYFYNMVLVERTTGQSIDFTFNSPREIGAFNVGSPASDIVLIDHFIGEDQATTPLLNFYKDYYLRIWLDPAIIRLSNPRIGSPLNFNVWNAYPDDNSLNTVLATDLPGVDLNFSLPQAFTPYQYRTLSFKITADAPATLDGHFDLTFDFGEARLRLIATLVAVMRAMPNEPIGETWSWLTAISLAASGAEQRTALRTEPRYTLQFDLTLTDGLGRRLRYNDLWAFISRDLQIPLYQYRTDITAPSSEGSNRIYFDQSLTDIRENEYFILYNPNDEATVLARGTLETDGITIEGVLSSDIGDNWWVIPTLNMRVPDGSGLVMDAVMGTATIIAQSMSRRPLLATSPSPSLMVWYDNFPVIPDRPIAVDTLNEAFTQGVESVDNNSANVSLYTLMPNPFIGGSRQWQIDREDMDELNYWREMGDYLKGCQKPFLLPTWREDLTLFEDAVLGSSTIKIRETSLIAQFSFNSHNRIQILSQNGIKYVGISEVEDQGDYILVTLDDSIGSDEGDEIIRMVSFLNVTRLSSDNIKLDHFVNWTIVTLEVKTVNE
jgi:hypothetical protein